MLESCYRSNPNPQPAIEAELAEIFNVKLKKVKHWFYCRRLAENPVAGTVCIFIHKNLYTCSTLFFMLLLANT